MTTHTLITRVETFRLTLLDYVRVNVGDRMSYFIPCTFVNLTVQMTPHADFFTYTYRTYIKHIQVYELANLLSRVMMDEALIKTDFCVLINGLYFARIRHLCWLP